MITILCSVKAGARRNEIQELPSGEISLRITERAVDGKANAAIIAYLSELLGIRQRDVRIEKGLTSRRKRVSIDVSDSKWTEFRSSVFEK